MSTYNYYTVHLPDGTRLDVDGLTDIVLNTDYTTRHDPITPDSTVESPEIPMRLWCPTCEPDYKPLDNCWQVCYCPRHTPSIAGTVVPHFAEDEWFQGEAGGSVNQLACAVIHRGQSPSTPTSALDSLGSDSSLAD